MRYYALKDLVLGSKTIRAGTSFYSDKTFSRIEAVPIEDVVQVQEVNSNFQGDKKIINRFEVLTNKEPLTFFCPFCKKEHRVDSKIGREHFNRINIEKGFMGKVEIIFIRYNLKGIEDEAIRRIKENTLYKNYTITDFDNYKTKIPLSLLWNRLIKKSNAEYICLLNNDAYVTRGWLTEMIKGFNYKNVAMVGPSGNNVGGIQRRISTRGESIKYKNSFKEVRQLSGFCLLLKKSTLNKIGKFPKDVPFYGGESTVCIEARRKGYKLLWAQGAFVNHLGGASTRKANLWDKRRSEGIEQYAMWLQKSSPVLFITYNRLDYTKKALKSLMNSGCGNIIVFDNGSTDGTKEYLKKIKDKKVNVIFNKENIGVSGAMNKFFQMTKEEEFIGKVDNDTIVPKNWFADLISVSLLYSMDILQGKHKILNLNVKDFEQWTSTMKKIPTGLGKNIYISQWVGGSGISIRREKIKELISPTKWKLGGWTKYQIAHSGSIKKGFYDGVEVKLLDMKADNKIDDSKYPSYYRETLRTKFLKVEDVLENTKRYSDDGKIINVKSTSDTIIKILETLGEKFAFTRFGDGEILMLEKFEGKRVTQFNSLSFMAELREAFKISDKNYIVSVSAGMKKEEFMEKGLFAPFDTDIQIQKIIKKYRNDRVFYNPIVFHYLLVFKPRILKILFDQLRCYKLGFVGGKYLKGMRDFFDFKKMIITPPYQSYDTIDKWYPKVKKMADSVDIILLALGPTAKVVQKRLWGKNVSTIDIGSVASALVSNKNDTHTWISMVRKRIENAIGILRLKK